MDNHHDIDKKTIRSIYNKKRYEENKEDILKYRRERYKKLRENNKNIIVIKGEFILHFD